MSEIRDQRLYRDQHGTFDEYCRERWGWGRAYAAELIEGANAIQSLPESVSHGVHNERQARELAQVAPKKRVEVVEQAQAKAEAEERPMTARDIRQAAQETIIDIESKPASMELLLL